MKGGGGKSTVASCLAVHWHLGGRRPVIDADPQRSIARLAARERALGGVPVIEDMTVDACKTARRLAAAGDPVIIDTPGFNSATTLACLAATDFSSFRSSLRRSTSTACWIRSMSWSAAAAASGRCFAVSSPRRRAIRHRQAHPRRARRGGLMLLESEMTNRVIYPEAALWGATPSLIDGGARRARHRGDRRRGRHDPRHQAGGVSMNKRKLPKAITRPTDDLRQAAAERLADADQTTLAPELAMPVRTGEPHGADRDAVDAVRDGTAAADPARVAARGQRRTAKDAGLCDRRTLCHLLGRRRHHPGPDRERRQRHAIIVRMVRRLSSHYGVPFERDRARAIVVALAGDDAHRPRGGDDVNPLLSGAGRRLHRARRVVGRGGRLHPEHRARFRRAFRERRDAAGYFSPNALVLGLGAGPRASAARV